MQKLNLELSNSQIACTNRFIILIMWHASTFNVLTYTVATSCVAGVLRRVRVTLQGYSLHSTCRWRWWTPHPYVCFRWDLWGIYISFTLFIHVIALWYIHWCTVCASIPIQGWHRYTKAWPFEVGSLHKDYDFSVDPELITLVESDPFYGYESESVVAHLT